MSLPSQKSSQMKACEVKRLLKLAQSHLLPHISSADDILISDYLPPQRLKEELGLELPTQGLGEKGLEEILKKVLKYSVNTWSPGFMDKLYASTDAVGVVSEVLLAVLNTNVHVYQVSPALTIIEKETASSIARLFGFTSGHAGGLTFPGGSASNSTSMIIAKNTLFPETKVSGNTGYKFVVFTSEHGHYSVEKAAILLGLGSAAVRSIPVDKEGRMVVPELESAVRKAKQEGYTPFYVNAGAGTTVMGSYDPFNAIADVCQRYNLWMHVDGSWGGSVVFSDKHCYKLKGVQKADSVTVNPHKMLGVPMTCSFLITDDTRKFSKATSLKAGYLFHGDEDEEEVFDMAQLTMGCGRRADSLKMALGWIYYGKEGYEERINHAFETASYFTTKLSQNTNFYLLSSNPPPCLQVCFFYTPEGALSANARKNTTTTRAIAAKLIAKGFMIDYSPHPIHGEFFRAVVNASTSRDTVDRLINTIEEHVILEN
ncbi:putative glutamate decarboxylase [Tuber indicum]|nr:putative glutamate decarboxylase [Tuber indicum]